MFDQVFLAHPRSVGETYVEHATMAARFALRLFVAACACAIHAAVPALFPRTASRIIASVATGPYDYAI
jgi:hypothetical protein